MSMIGNYLKLSSQELELTVRAEPAGGYAVESENLHVL